MAIDELSYIYGPDLLPQRIPIGLTDVIRNVTRERVVAFYDAYYRPERATLIAVGDFDVDEMEAKIRAKFSDWRGRGTPGPEAPAPSIPAREMQTRVFIEPGVPTRASLNWVAPLDTSPDTRERRTRQMREQIAMQIFNRRIERLASGDNPPLIGGALVRHRVGLRAEVLQLIGVSQAGQWTRSLQTLEQEQRRAVQHGFTQAELDRAVAEMRTQLTAAAAGGATRPSPQVAMGIVNAVNEDQVVLAPAAQLELFNAAAEACSATPSRWCT
jgi:zinc protease